MADLVDIKGRSSPEVLVAAVELAINEGLSGSEIVALVDELERRTGTPIHPFRF